MFVSPHGRGHRGKRLGKEKREDVWRRPSRNAVNGLLLSPGLRCAAAQVQTEANAAFLVVLKCFPLASCRRYMFFYRATRAFFGSSLLNSFFVCILRVCVACCVRSSSSSPSLPNPSKKEPAVQFQPAILICATSDAQKVAAPVLRLRLEGAGYKRCVAWDYGKRRQRSSLTNAPLVCFASPPPPCAYNQFVHPMFVKSSTQRSAARRTNPQKMHLISCLFSDQTCLWHKPECTEEASLPIWELHKNIQVNPLKARPHKNKPLP
jgi:hypothetical protein